MRLFIDHVTSSPNTATGLTTYTFCIAAALARLPGYEVYFLTNWDSAQLPAKLKSGRMQVITCKNPSNETLSFLTRGIARLRLEAKLKPDIVFSPQPYAFPTWRAANVMTVHDLYRNTHPEIHSIAQLEQWRALFPASLRVADAVICVSNATRNALVQYYPRCSSKVRVVHEAPPVSTSVPTNDRSEVGNYALMVANVAPTKNIASFFKAIMILRDSGFSGEFVLAGKDHNGEIAAFLASQPHSGLRWIQNPSEEILVDLYRHARCYVNCSVAEGFCLPVLEAQGFGVPVICSDLQVLREVAGAGAVFFRPGEATTLAQLIWRVFNEPSLALDLSRAAVENVRRFSWERAAQETADTFTLALERRNDKPTNPRARLTS